MTGLTSRVSAANGGPEFVADISTVDVEVSATNPAAEPSLVGSNAFGSESVESEGAGSGGDDFGGR